MDVFVSMRENKTNGKDFLVENYIHIFSNKCFTTGGYEVMLLIFSYN